jgi:heme/copper-type cytochrome/quinol oxidase subunit 1
MAETPARDVLRAWMGLAVLALALAGVMAVLLAASRIPGSQDLFPWPVAFFERGLVAHVVFSFVVWFLAAYGLQLALAAPAMGNATLDWIALAAAAISFVLLLIPSLSDRGEPALNNYIPAVTDGLYYAGLAVLAGAVLLPVIRFLFGLAWGAVARSPQALILGAGGIAYVLALVAFALSARALGPFAPSYDFNESLFWSGGHILQFLNVAILIAAWIALAERIADGPADPMAFRLSTGLLVLGAGAGLGLDIALGAHHPARWSGFAQLQYALAPAPLIAAGTIARRLWPAFVARPALSREPAFLALALSIAVFGVGGILGLFVDGADTRTPAHYHGVIGGINLALMGLFLAIALPRAGRAPRAGRILALQIWLYGAGQALASLGLFWAGGYGAPRKAAGEAQGLVDLGAKLGLYLNGIGALIAVMGGILFIVTVAGALLRRERSV